ncbi:MAG: helix-turn-helix transcriptional regulator [bacterium]|nr:helix-turn-helix transcriptional regulator [bacterium]
MADPSKKKYLDDYFKNDTERFKDTSGANLKSSIVEYFLTADTDKLNHINVERLANVFGRHPSYISRQFSQYYGLSLNAILTSERMFRVSKLLKSKARRDASELYKQFGYVRGDYFVIVFKKTFHVHPDRFPQQDKKVADSFAVSFLANPHHFFLGDAFIINAGNQYRLIVEFQNKILKDLTYGNAKGARISFLKLFSYRNWEKEKYDKFSSLIWTPFYVPEDAGFLQKIAGIWDMYRSDIAFLKNPHNLSWAIIIFESAYYRLIARDSNEIIIDNRYDSLLKAERAINPAYPGNSPPVWSKAYKPLQKWMDERLQGLPLSGMNDME